MNPGAGRAGSRPAGLRCGAPGRTEGHGLSAPPPAAPQPVLLHSRTHPFGDFVPPLVLPQRRSQNRSTGFGAWNRNGRGSVTSPRWRESEMQREWRHGDAEQSTREQTCGVPGTVRVARPRPAEPPARERPVQPPHIWSTTLPSRALMSSSRELSLWASFHSAVCV